MTYLNDILAKNGMMYHRIVVDADPIPLIPTRVPRVVQTAGEKFVHVPKVVVIKQSTKRPNCVEITVKMSTYTEVVSNDNVLNFLRSLATTLLMASHKMKHYRKLLHIVMRADDKSGSRVESVCLAELFTYADRDKPLMVVIHKYKF